MCWLAHWILHLGDIYVCRLATNAKVQCTPQYSSHIHEYIWRYISYHLSSFSTVSPDNTSCNFFFFLTGSSILPCYGRLGLSFVLYYCLPLAWDILNPSKMGILTLSTHPWFLCSWFSIVTCQTWWLKIVHQNRRKMAESGSEAEEKYCWTI